MKYRKKPIIVEAFQIPFSKEGMFDKLMDESIFPKWFWDAEKEGKVAVWHTQRGYDGNLFGAIYNGDHQQTITWGTWIIKGVADELYHCKPDIFKKTYEKVE